MILSALTSDYVVQASDRRLSDPRTRQPVEHDANKAVVFCGHIAVGYTGLSRIEGMATDLWITDVLRRCSTLEEAVKGLCERATEGLARVGQARDHAFVLAGWCRVDERSDVRPCAFIISNFFRATPEGTWLATPTDEFTYARRLPEPHELPMVISVPQAPTGPQTKVSRALADVVARGLGPTAIGRVLEDGIRQVAAIRRGVGSDAMVCSIPRSVIETGTYSTVAVPAGEPLSRTEISSYYAATQDDILISEPNFVCKGMVTARTRITVNPRRDLTKEYIDKLASDFGPPRPRQA